MGQGASECLPVFLQWWKSEREKVFRVKAQPGPGRWPGRWVGWACSLAGLSGTVALEQIPGEWAQSVLSPVLLPFWATSLVCVWCGSLLYVPHHPFPPPRLYLTLTQRTLEEVHLSMHFVLWKTSGDSKQKFPGGDTWARKASYSSSAGRFVGYPKL